MNRPEAQIFFPQQIFFMAWINFLLFICVCFLIIFSIHWCQMQRWSEEEKCTRKSELVYIKTHKTGSCTITNVLYRWGIHQLIQRPMFTTQPVVDVGSWSGRLISGVQRSSLPTVHVCRANCLDFLFVALHSKMTECKRRGSTVYTEIKLLLWTTLGLRIKWCRSPLSFQFFSCHVKQK